MSIGIGDSVRRSERIVEKYLKLRISSVIIIVTVFPLNLDDLLMFPGGFVAFVVVLMLSAETAGVGDVCCSTQLMVKGLRTAPAILNHGSYLDFE